MARLLEGVRGHQKEIGRLLSAFQKQKLASTFLFVGPEGVGRRRVAQALAQVFVCESRLNLSQTTQACGECGPCLRVAKHQSESVLEVAPEKNQIKIEQAHEILHFLSLKTHAQARVVIIDSAHLLNPYAANSLLKLFEEPPQDCYFILLAPSPRHVLPTLRSRSQIVRFSALSAEELKSERPAPDWAIQSAMGSFSRLQSYLDRDEIESRQFALNTLRRLLSVAGAASAESDGEGRTSAVPDIFYLETETRDWIKDRVVILSLCRYWISFLRDALLLQWGESNRLMNPDQLKTIEELAKSSAETLNLIVRRLFELESELNSQKDVSLSFEKFWIQSRQNMQQNFYREYSHVD